jgi:hypothetical protein
MATPVKLNIDWFKTTSKLKISKQERELIADFGAEGYGMWIIFKMELASADNCMIEGSEIKHVRHRNSFDKELWDKIFIFTQMSKLLHVKVIDGKNFYYEKSISDSLKKMLNDRYKRNNYNKNKKTVT